MAGMWIAGPLTCADPKKCLCQGRGAYYVVAQESAMIQHIRRVLPDLPLDPIPQELVPCNFHSLENALSDADRSMLAAVGIS